MYLHGGGCESLKKHLIATLLVFFVLIGSDLTIGALGHYVGSGEESLFVYLTDLNNYSELFVVFFISLLVVTFLRFGLPFLGLPKL